MGILVFFLFFFVFTLIKTSVNSNYLPYKDRIIYNSYHLLFFVL
jgi:hypothetical protein